MKKTWFKGAIGCLAASLLGGCSGGPTGEGELGRAEEALSSTAYSGRAAVLNAKVALVSASLADTGALPAAGGTKDVALLTASVPGILTADAVEAFVSGQNEHTVSQSDVAGVNVGIAAAGLNLSAGVLQTTATAQCAGGVASVGAGSVITGLRINGQAITVTGAPNQTVNLLLGKVIINERSSSQSGDTASIHTAAIHVVVAGLVDVSIATADAGITCAPLPPPPPAPTCTDGIQNGAETDIDCGPTCAPCDDGGGCTGNSDCQSNHCDGGTCTPPPPTCTDGIQNGDETGVDCGGPTCGTCADGSGCATNADCQSGTCDGGTCVVCTPVDYVVGQGYITTTPSNRAGTFSLYGEVVNGAPTGHMKYDDDGSSEHIQSTDVTAYTVLGPATRRIQGHATIFHKTGTFTYTVDVTDNGASGDVFTISVSDGYQASGTVASGDVKLTVNTCP